MVGYKLKKFEPLCLEEKHHVVEKKVMGGKKDTEYSFETNTKILIRLHRRKGLVKDTVREREEQM